MTEDEAGSRQFSARSRAMRTRASSGRSTRSRRSGLTPSPPLYYLDTQQQASNRLALVLSGRCVARALYEGVNVPGEARSV